MKRKLISSICLIDVISSITHTECVPHTIGWCGAREIIWPIATNQTLINRIHTHISIAQSDMNGCKVTSKIATLAIRSHFIYFIFSNLLYFPFLCFVGTCLLRKTSWITIAAKCSSQFRVKATGKCTMFMKIPNLFVI